MNHARLQLETQDIVLDEVFPHAPDTIWKALTTGDLIARWMMPPIDFEPVKGNRFKFQTTPAGVWDGTISCEVLEVVPERRFVYAWRGGHESNVGYGSPLDSVVSWHLTKADTGTRVRLVHSGFVKPTNDETYRNMSTGWKKVFERLDDFAAGHDASGALCTKDTKH